MSKKIVIIWIALFLLFGFIFINSGNEQITEVHSDDGKVILYVSNNSLPNNITLGDIKIESKNTNDFLGHSSGELNEIEFAYDLQPDGLEFKKPVKILIKSDWSIPEKKDEIGVPLLLHKSGNEIDIVDNTIIDYDIENKIMNIGGDINHFSEIASTKVNMFYVNMDPVISLTDNVFELELKESSRVLLKAKPYQTEFSKHQIAIGKTEFIVIGDSWELISGNGKINSTGDFFLPNSSNIPSKKINVGEEYEFIERGIVCTNEGDSSFSVTKPITFKADIKMFAPHFYEDKHVGKKLANGTAHEDGTIHSDTERHYTKVFNDKIMTVNYPFTQTRKCGKTKWKQLEPFTIVCPDFSTRSGVYYIDPDTGERVTNANGEPISPVSGLVINDDCSKAK